MLVAKLIATCLGIGYLQKGAGTVAALFCCAFWYGFRGAELSLFLQLTFLVVIFLIGVMAAGAVEKLWGHDSNRVVIDEVLGMLVTLFLVPHDWRYVLLAVVLFRFFDIAKPLGIRKMENLPGGWGVMMDDFLAGLYSAVLLHLIIQSHLFS